MFSMMFFLLGVYLGWQAKGKYSHKIDKVLSYVKNPKLLFKKKRTDDLDRLG